MSMTTDIYKKRDTSLANLTTEEDATSHRSTMRGLYVVPVLSVLVIAVTLVKPGSTSTTEATEIATLTQGGGTTVPGVTTPASATGNDTTTDDADATVEMTTAGANSPTKYAIFGLTAVLLPLLGGYYS
ncbi:uncharacterized protein [Ptychodera flava]|uniref:uncharacterized protein n=1 Tax=Ptychodera flava TaxID=63121 RepID=UPI00396A8DA3